MTRYAFELATSSDDDALRRRMAEDVLNGNIAVTFRREPNYFAGTALQGNEAQVIKCVDQRNQRIVGLFTRAKSAAYLNGEPTGLGYLCDLRADPAVRGGTLLARGYKALRVLHDAAPIALYSTMILNGNDAALDILTSGRVSLPRYRPLGKILTPAVHLDRARRYRFSGKLRIARATTMASTISIDDIIRFVNAQNQRQQFSPVYQTDDLGSAKLQGLQLDDIYLALDDERIVGCVACWDQSAVRQIFVERYSPVLRLVRPLYNLVAGTLSRKPLPSTNTKIPFFYLALIAIENDEPDVFRELLEHIYAERRHGPWHFFIAGLHENNPLKVVLEEFRSISAAGHLFAVHWPDGANAFEQLDGRTPHIEIGAL